MLTCDDFCSYPACCVLKGPPLVYPDRDTHITTSSFIADLHSRIPSICGEKISFSSNAYNVANALHPASCSDTGMQQLGACSPSVSNPSLSILDRQSFANTSNPLNTSSNPSPSNPSLSTLSNPTPSKSSLSNPLLSTLSNQPLHTLSNLSDRPVGSENIDPFSSHATTPAQDGGVKSSKTATKRAALSLSGRSKQVTPVDKKFRSSSSFEGAPNPDLVSQTVPDMHHNSLSSQVDNEVSLHPRQGHCEPSASSAVAALPTLSTLPSDNARVPGHIMFKVEKSKVGDLKKWLQDKGHRNLSKKRKDDLIQMVAVCIRNTGSAYPWIDITSCMLINCTMSN